MMPGGSQSGRIVCNSGQLTGNKMMSGIYFLQLNGCEVKFLHCSTLMGILMDLPTTSPEQARGTPDKSHFRLRTSWVMNPLKNDLQDPQKFSMVTAWSGVSLECFPFPVYKTFTHSPKFVLSPPLREVFHQFLVCCHLDITRAHDLFLHISPVHYRNTLCSKISSQVPPNIKAIQKPNTILYLNFAVLKEDKNKMHGCDVGSVT